MNFSGDKFCINVYDMFGFECFSVNRLEQLVVNSMNEEMQCYYNQRVFNWEMVSTSKSIISTCDPISLIFNSKNKTKRTYQSKDSPSTTTKRQWTNF